ncbi:MAG: hypothetical protein KKG92_12055 [Gammaproteobacteria bacterium]|nr:hypothetical protein [Gammaproteobacteria bacterium]
MSENDRIPEWTTVNSMEEANALELKHRPVSSDLTEAEVAALASKIVDLVHQECDVQEKSYGVGDALMLASHHLLGWRDFRKLIG